MKNSDAKKMITQCHCKIDRRRSSGLQHECRWRITKLREKKRRAQLMSWDTSQAIEVFASCDAKSIEDANGLFKNTNALAALLLKGFRRYQTKLLIRKTKADQKLQKNRGVEI